jgi:hypothetical protein
MHIDLLNQYSEQCSRGRINKFICENDLTSQTLKGKIMLKNIICYLAAAIAINTMLPIQSAKAAAPVYCGQENSSCSLSFGELRDAYYGANGRYAHKVVQGTFSCNNATFGDPAYGSIKQCFIGDATYTYALPEWDNPTSTPTIQKPEPVIVAFGNLQTQNFSARVFGNGNCDKNTFGDPAPGYTKSCYSGPTFTYCAPENGTCAVNGLTLVAYGPYGGPFTYKAVSGPVACNNANFGDPARNYVKKCFVKPI